MNYVRLKYRMLRYARNHDLDIPPGFRAAIPKFQEPARKLAWRITTHMVEHKVKGATVSAEPHVINRIFFPLPPQAALQDRIVSEAKLAISKPVSGVAVQNWYGMWGAWCAMSWSYIKAKAGSTTPKMAYVPFILSSAAKRENGLMLVSPSKALPGDGVIFDWQFDHDADHIETLLSKYGNIITTAAGNSGSPYVVKRVRTTYNVIGYVRVTR